MSQRGAKNMSVTEPKLNAIGEPILLATDIMNVPAFWNSLSPVQKEAVREADAAQQLGQRTVDAFTDDADLAVWGNVQRRYQVEVVEPSEKTRQEAQAVMEDYEAAKGKGIPLADWLNSKSVDPFAAPATVVDSVQPVHKGLVSYTPSLQGEVLFTETDLWACWEASKHHHRFVGYPNFAEWLKSTFVHLYSRPTDSKADSPKPLWPQTGTGYDADVFEVNYKDEIQVVIDRTQNDSIQLRVWRIGDDNPLSETGVLLPTKTDCKNCHDRVGEDFLDDNRYCVDCTKPYQPEEIEKLLNFAEGYARAISNNAKAIDDVNGDVDEWVSVEGGSEQLDIHFKTNDDETSGSFGMLEAWGYRRPTRDGDMKCENELRLI